MPLHCFLKLLVYLGAVYIKEERTRKVNHPSTMFLVFSLQSTPFRADTVGTLSQCPPLARAHSSGSCFSVKHL